MYFPEALENTPFNHMDSIKAFSDVKCILVLTLMLFNNLLCYVLSSKLFTVSTEDGSTEALVQILYGQYLILGVFGSFMF